MKISAQEEYGLRILLRIAQSQSPDGITIPEISRSEGLSSHNVAKLCRILRLAGFVKSSRGSTGGYTLAMPVEKIVLGDILRTLGGRLFDDDFCGNHSGVLQLCTNSVDCTIRSLWQIIQINIDEVVDNITLKNLLGPTNDLSKFAPTQQVEFVSRHHKKAPVPLS
jgi:Rrf2 family protein